MRPPVRRCPGPAGTVAATLVALVAVVASSLLWPAAALGTASEAPGANNDSAGSDAARELAQRYAPLVRLQFPGDDCDQGEQYTPIEVDAVLANVEVALRGPWTAADLIEVAPTADAIGAGLPGYFLDFPGNALRPGCTYAEWSKRLNKEFAPAVYAHVATDPGFPGQVALQYWFFYIFNDYNNTHEGDWESIQLIFDAPSAEAALEVPPTSVGYSQHGGAERALWGDEKLEVVDETHPVVYPAAGSHANHYGTDLYLGRGSEGLGCDDTTNPQPGIAPEVVLISSSEESLAEHPWVAFEGRWGERQGTVFDGPTGPSQKGSWDRPIRSAEDTWRNDSTTVPAGGLLGSSATDAFCSTVKVGSNLFREAMERPWLLVLVVAIVAGLIWFAGSRTRWLPANPVPARARRGWGQCVTSAVRLFLDRPLLFVLLSLVLLPLGFATSVLTRLGATEPVDPDLDAPTDDAGLVLGLLAVALSVVTVLVYVAMLAAMSRILARADDGQEIGTREALRHLRTRWRPLLGVTVVYAAVISVLALLVITIPVAIYYAVSRAYALPAAVVEERSSLAALRRSRQLVRGRWWANAVALAVIVGIGLLAGPALGITLLLGTDLPPVLANLATGMFRALALPLVAAAVAYLYFDAVAREDAEAAADASETPVASGR